MNNEFKSEAMSLQVAEDLTVSLIPNANHEFLMTTQEVAFGYGVKDNTLRSHANLNKDEFMPGKHFVEAVEIFDAMPQNMQPHQKLWTKRGIVRLGFFIKTIRAKMFRDWAEDLILEKIENKVNEPEPGIDSTQKLMKVILNLKDQSERLAVYEAFQELKNEVDIYKETNRVYLLAEKSRILKKLPQNRSFEENRILQRARFLNQSA